MRNARNASFKRILSAALAVMIMCAGIPAVFAREYNDVTAENTARDEIDILSDIGVIIGTSENEFSPDENVTREQMALLLFRLMLNKQSGGRVNTSPFTDLYDDTYHGAISWANASGYILGTSGSTFEPLEGITLQDAMTMLVRALGQSSNAMNNGYPWTYIDAAIKLGLDRGLENVAYTETLTRGETAIILYNALTAEYLVPKSLAGGNVIYETTTIIERVFGYEMDEATIVATNDYALVGNTVVKDGYVTLRYYNDANLPQAMTVNFSELGLNGSANDYLGRTFKVIYTINSNNKLISVLSAIENSETEVYTSAEVNTTNGYVTIGGNNYTVVENFSDILATNANELLVYAYENDKTLTQLTTLDALNARLGLYAIELVFYGDSSTASVAILRNFQVGKFQVDTDGKINIAGNLTEAQLTGGFSNKADAKIGEYVLYYFNSQTKELEIVEVLDILFGVVTRITSTNAKIAGVTYKLGNAKAGITASSIASALMIGANAQVVIRGDEILAVIGETIVTEHSNYLVAMTNALPVFTNGAFRYVVTVNIDGINRNIYTANASVTAGEVYRYTVNGDMYTLIAPEVSEGVIATGINKFVQNGFGTDEIAVIIDSANGTTLSKGENTYFTFSAGEASIAASLNGASSMKFVTDHNTTILVVNEGELQVKKGAYNSAIHVNDGAKVVAVFANEAGSVETLRYLYVSDGSLGNYDSAAQSVRLLALNGVVFENNVTYLEYTVFNYATGAVENRLTTVVGLTLDSVYLIGSDGTIVDVNGEIASGEVTGHTASTVTIGETTYHVNASTRIVQIGEDHKVAAKKLSDTFGKTVEYIANGDTVSLIVIQ